MEDYFFKYGVLLVVVAVISLLIGFGYRALDKTLIEKKSIESVSEDAKWLSRRIEKLCDLCLSREDNRECNLLEIELKTGSINQKDLSNKIFLYAPLSNMTQTIKIEYSNGRCVVRPLDVIQGRCRDFDRDEDGCLGMTECSWEDPHCIPKECSPASDCVNITSMHCCRSYDWMCNWFGDTKKCSTIGDINHGCKENCDLLDHPCCGFTTDCVWDTGSRSCSNKTVVSKFHKKIMILSFDPLIESQGSQKLHKVLNWNDPVLLSKSVIQSISDSSGEQVIYEIAETLDVDDIPIKSDGFKYTDDTYLECWNDHNTCHEPDQMDYKQILSSFNICDKVNNGEIDELWLWGGPWFGYGEAAMAGPGAFFINGPVITGTTCSKKLPIMGFNYERGVGEALESYGHRIEATLTKVFGGWDVTLSRHDWDRFGHNKGQTPGVSFYQCGSVHYGPNSLTDYDWSNSDYVESNCDDWYNYPEFLNKTKQINCEAWNCNIEGHHAWWMSHLPRYEGEKNTIKNNWWFYVVNPEEA